MCCGAGVVAAHMQAMLRRQGRESDGVVRITCADSSEAQLEHVRRRIREEKCADTKAVHADVAAGRCLVPEFMLMTRGLRRTESPFRVEHV